MCCLPRALSKFRLGGKLNPLRRAIPLTGVIVGWGSYQLKEVDSSKEFTSPYLVVIKIDRSAIRWIFSRPGFKEGFEKYLSGCLRITKSFQRRFPEKHTCRIKYIRSKKTLLVIQNLKDHPQRRYDFALWVSSCLRLLRTMVGAALQVDFAWNRSLKTEAAMLMHACSSICTRSPILRLSTMQERHNSQGNLCENDLCAIWKVCGRIRMSSLALHILLLSRFLWNAHLRRLEINLTHKNCSLTWVGSQFYY